MSTKRMVAHPACAIFPKMSDAEYEALKKDIAEHGVREPITTYNGVLLDGRHRLRACEELGILCPRTEFKGTKAQAIAYVWSKNGLRRNLTPSQIAMMAAKLALLLQDSSDDESNLRGASSVSKGESIAFAANAVGASVMSVERAAAVLATGDEELIEAVEQKKVSVTAAAKTARERKPKKARKSAPKAPKEPKLPPDTVSKAEHDRLVEEYAALEENWNDIAAELEAVNTPKDEQQTKIAQLLVELKACKRARDDAMQKVVEMGQQVKWWKAQAVKLGWKAKEKA